MNIHKYFLIISTFCLLTNCGTSSQDKVRHVSPSTTSSHQEKGSSNATQEKTYKLEVQNGTGSGEYKEGAEVTIKATFPYSQIFSSWTGDTSFLSNVKLDSQTFKMPNRNVSLVAWLLPNPNPTSSAQQSTTPTTPAPQPQTSNDGFNLADVIFPYPCEGEIKNWKEAYKLTLNHGGGNSFSPDWGGKNIWKSETLNERALIGNVVMVYQKNGKWHASSIDWQPKDMFPRDFNNVWHFDDLNHLKKGDKIGIMITGLIRNCWFRNVNERTSIEWTTLP